MRRSLFVFIMILTMISTFTFSCSDMMNTSDGIMLPGSVPAEEPQNTEQTNSVEEPVEEPLSEADPEAVPLNAVGATKSTTMRQ